MDEKTCMVDIARFFLSFTQDESCGKCTPCRLGTKRMLEILTRITQGEGRSGRYRAFAGDGAKHQGCLALRVWARPVPTPCFPRSPNSATSTRPISAANIARPEPAKSLVFAPCENTCPVRCDAVGYASLIAAGRYEEALSIIRLTMPLAGICGRVCNHPCENMCKRGEIDEPLAIASLKRFASDWERKQKNWRRPRSWRR